jgi:hypothetical protein
MFGKFLEKSPLVLLIGIPLLLLTFSFMLSSTEEINKVGSEYNNYRDALPEKYIGIINKANINDSTYFFSVYQDYGIRELIVFKASPTKQEISSNFSIELTVETKTEKGAEDKKVSFTIENEAVLYNYNGKTYGVYKKILPFVIIKDLLVTRKVINKWQKKWTDSMQRPFKALKTNNQIELTNRLGFQRPTNPYISLFMDMLEQNEIQFLPYTYTQTKEGLKQTQENLDNYIEKEELIIGLVLNQKQFWKFVNEKNDDVLKLISFRGENKVLASQLIEKYINGDLGFESVFNVEKLARFFSIKSVFSNRCDEHMHFIYNAYNKHLEPYFVHSQCIGKMNDYLVKPIIEDINFVEAYLQSLKSISQIDLYTEFVLNNSSFEQELNLINDNDINKVFSLDLLKINQRVIGSNLITKTSIRPEFIRIDGENLVLSVFNYSNYPITVRGLNHKKNKSITQLSAQIQILSGKKDTLIIPLPRSFENLFVSKKNKTIGFILHKHIYDLYLSYSVSGLYDVEYASIRPYQTNEKTGEDIFRTETFINNHNAISIDKDKGVISFKSDSVVISQPLVIPSGFVFMLEAGMTLNIMDGGKIISHSPLNFIGTKLKPIKIISSDKKGQGILVLSEERHSYLKFVEFNDLSNPKHGNWSVTGAVTFYESPVELDYVTVKNNRCEDALNIVRTTFLMTNCNISDTQSDAFDGDFVTGIVKDSKFINLGNDAIDISGSDLEITNVQIIAAGDKGLSAGEDSKMTVNNVSISNSEIAVAGKDLSIINARNLKIENTKLAFTAFQKKPEFGPSNIIVDGVIMTNIELNYLVESTSSLLIDGKKVESSQNVKERMYGVEFGVSSDKTRNQENKN